MLFHGLDRTREGLLVCVFDGPDRVQHMFYRTLDPEHPANEGRRLAGFEDVLPAMYGEMDDLVGRVMERVDDGETTLLVISDHGFCPFRRGVNLNTWLRDNGYLALEEDSSGPEEAGDWFAGVDWSRTRAFALGLAGIFLNRAGREARGVVTEAEAGELKRELIAGLEGLGDDGRPAIRKVWDAESLLPRPLQEGGAGPARRLQRRVPGLLERRQGADRRPRLRGQHPPLERRPLRRSRPGARGPVLQPACRQAGPAPARRAGVDPAPLRRRAACLHAGGGSLR